MRFRAGLLWLSAVMAMSAEGAASVERSPFPLARGVTEAALIPVQAGPRDPALSALAPESSLRPAARPAQLRAPTAGHGNSDFDHWLRGFRRRALGAGVSARVFDQAFAGVRPDPDILRHEAHQPEFNRPIWEYLDTAVSSSRIENGQRMLREHRRVLDEIEARYGVDREVVVAVWGMESAYGRLRGTTQIIPALSTLAMHSRRSDFYEQQLIGALRIVQAGDVDSRHLLGSWAGAMGHTQFIPTSYLAYAVDFRGDGHRDIWSDDPTDSLASTAAYLSRHGWQRGQPWGVEVRLPRNFNPRLANTRRGVGEWRSRR